MMAKILFVGKKALTFKTVCVVRVVLQGERNRERERDREDTFEITKRTNG